MLIKLENKIKKILSFLRVLKSTFITRIKSSLEDIRQRGCGSFLEILI